MDIAKNLYYRFENQQTQRYYRVFLSQDLFGDWIITKIWGGISKSNGRIVHIPCSEYNHALKVLDDIFKQRKRRGYSVCEA